MPRQELETLQLERLQALLHTLDKRTPFYAQKFKEIGFEPSDLKSLADLSKLPLTSKQDLLNHYPQSLSAVEPRDITRYHTSSGATGKISVVGYTANDVELWKELMARTLTVAGLTSEDVVNVAFNYGLFSGGLGVHYGAERLGAAVLPCSVGHSQRQVRLMSHLKVTVLCCTPSYALYLAEVAREIGMDFRDKDQLPLKIGVFGAEPWSEALRSTIESKLAIDAVNIYGLSEVMGPGVSVECRESRHGLHIFEDHFIAEIIDPVTTEVLGPGQEGELVLTTLTKEATPLLRYRTKDITSFIQDDCPCRRTFRRMTRVMGRSDDVLIVRGVNIFPSDLETLILETNGLSPNYEIIVDRYDNLDTLEIQVEPNPDYPFPLFEDQLSVTVGKKIKDYLGVSARIKLLPLKTLVREQNKSHRVFDRRQGKI
jgi:phenylacetate-CoA ligase